MSAYESRHSNTRFSGSHSSTYSHTHTTRVAGEFSQHARCSHQVHGGAAWRMWLNKQLRWRLSKALNLCLCGLRERERKREKEGRRRERERERLSQSICIKVMGQCVTWQCKQILTQPCLWGRGEAAGMGNTPNPPGCSPFPPRPAESSKC